MFDEQRAARAVRFFENLRHTKGRFYGQPFKLLGWQEPIVRDVYGTLLPSGLRQYKYIWVEIAKKNGKSELCAGAGLYQTFADGERNGEVYGCAAEKKQAAIVFDVAVDMIDQAPALKKRAKLTLSQKKITDKVSGTFYQVVSAEAYSKHGLNPSAVIFDEVHAQPNRNLWDVMTFGAGDARSQPIWWLVTTAGDDPDRVTIGWEQHEYAARILAGDIVDPTWYPVIYSYDGDDIYNEKHWREANPSLGETITVESMREAAARAKVKPADERLFRWLKLNQWITTKLTAWLPLDLFDKAEGDWERAELLGKECFMGLDLSTTTDLSGLCLIFPPQEGLGEWRVIWEAWIPKENMQARIAKDHVPYDVWAAHGWVTPTPGDWIDYDVIEARIVELAGLFQVQEVAYDPAFAVMLIQHLMKAGLDCVPIKQHYDVLTDPMNEIGVKLGNGRMTHEPNAAARWCFGNTSVAKNGNGQIKYVKETRGRQVMQTKRIDLLAAWVIGMVRALAKVGSDSESVYETRGLLTV